MLNAETAMRSVWFVWWVSWLVAAAWSDRAVKRPPRRQQIIYRVLAATGAILLFGLYQHDVSVEHVLWHTPAGVMGDGRAGLCRSALYLVGAHSSGTPLVEQCRPQSRSSNR